MFVDEENIPLIQEEDYDDYNIPNTSRIDTRHRLWFLSGNISPTIKKRSKTR